MPVTADIRTRPIVRLVTSTEGEYRVVRFAAVGTMEGSFVLGTIHLGAVHRHQHRWSDFVDLMRHLAQELSEEAIGERVAWCDVRLEDID